MSDQRNGGIAWTDETWNPVRGCSRVSDGCRWCYAERVAARFSGPGQPYEGLTRKGRWTGEVRLVPEHLADPLRWKRPRRVFVNSMSDLFHESLSDETIAAVFGVMAASPQHTFQVLTKRPERAREWFLWISSGRLGPLPGGGVATTCMLIAERTDGTRDHPATRGPRPNDWPLPNVWLGVSVEDQAAADARIPLLLECPAAVRWISAEPLLGPIVLRPEWLPLPRSEPDDFRYWVAHDNRLRWVVVGGESGPGARPMHPEWARRLRDQCSAAGVPFFFKQWGHWVPPNQLPDATFAALEAADADLTVEMLGLSKVGAGRELDRRTWDEFPGPAAPAPTLTLLADLMWED